MASFKNGRSHVLRTKRSLCSVDAPAGSGTALTKSSGNRRKGLDNMTLSADNHGMNGTTDTNNNGYWFDSIVAQPDGFVRPVRIRRIITRTGVVRFQYFGLAGRWLPIARDRAAMGVGEPSGRGHGSMNRPYTVMAYRNGDCFAFRRVQRPRTVRTTADAYVIDDNATRVVVTHEAAGIVADWNATGGWMNVRDPRLVDTLSADYEL